MKHMPASPVIRGQVEKQETGLQNRMEDTTLDSVLDLSPNSTARLNILTTERHFCHINVTCKIRAGV